jgi:Uma2 family endonuclease
MTRDGTAKEALYSRSLMEALSPPDAELAANVDQRVMFWNVSWDAFEAFLRMKGESSGVRVAYLEGALELMSPSEGHESTKTKWARILEALAEEVGVLFEGRGSWTLKRRREETGAEPDECYFVGHAEGKVPDLALEVVWTSGGLDKLEICRRLGVREVHVWERSRISVHVLRRGGYVPAESSEVWPELDLSLVARCLKRPTQTEAVRLLRSALRRGKARH